MYQFAYDEVVEDRPSKARSDEVEAFNRAIQLLTEAEQSGPRSRQRVDALFFVTRLWTVLIEDLAKPENDLPPQLRADLISIGIWSLREVERIRISGEGSLKDVIEISTIIRDGLK